MVEQARAAEQAYVVAPMGERFYLAAILLYIVLVIVLVAHLAQMFSGSVPNIGHGRVAVAGWSVPGAW